MSTEPMFSNKGTRKHRSFELSGVKEPLRSAILYLLGGVIVTTYGVVSLSQPEAMRLKCERKPPVSGVCQLTVVGFLGQHIQVFPLDQLEGAIERRNGKYSSVVLLLNDERVAMPGQIGSSTVLEQRDRINSFITTSSEPTLVITQDNRIDAYTKASVCIGFGAMMLSIGSTYLKRPMSAVSERTEVE